jgi:hypothetical protein
MINGSPTFNTLTVNNTIEASVIEFTKTPSNAGNGGAIDFHFNGSTADYTSRIIENESGKLYIPGSLDIGGDPAYPAAIADWIDAGIIQLDRLGESFKAIDIIRSTVLLDGSEWKIKDKGLSGRLGGMPLFITLGLAEN